LIILFLIERGLLSAPLLYLSAFFEATRSDYYSLLRGVTERGNWEEWLEYFLNAAARQAEDAVSRAERINTLLSRWHQAVAGSASKTPPKIIDLLAENPFWTITRLAERLGVAFTTAQRAVERLESARILASVKPVRRDRVYCAKAILDILEEPPVLTPA
jgi:Fic family protein